MADWEEELWRSDEPLSPANSSFSRSKMHSGFNSGQRFIPNKQFASIKARDEESRYSETSDVISPFNQFESYDKDFFGYNTVFGFGMAQEDEGYDEAPSHIDNVRPRSSAFNHNLIQNDAIPPVIIKKLVEDRQAQTNMVLSAAEDDILCLDIDELAKQKIRGILETCKDIMEPSVADNKVLDARIYAYNARNLKMEIAQEQQRFVASVEDDQPSTRCPPKSEFKMRSESRLHKVQRNSARSSNNSECSVDPSNLFGHMNVEDVFRRSTDGKDLWKEMELHRNDSSYCMDHKVEKLFVRILGYTLMDFEKRLTRLISAAERREFMTIVAQSIPMEINLDRFANSTSKGLLDMFIRNKRHYQARKYGISLSSAPKKERQ